MHVFYQSKEKMTEVYKNVGIQFVKGKNEKDQPEIRLSLIHI